MNSFESQWQRWFPEDKDKRAAPRVRRGWTVSRVLLILAGVVALFILLNIIKGFYTEWLWFDALGYGSVYATILKTKVLVFFIAAIVFGILFLGNLVLATRLAPRSQASFWPWAIASRLQRILRWVVIIGTALLCLIFGLVAQGNWQVILRFFNGQSFGITDPVFHREVGFYVFTLPYLHLWHGWLLGALIITLLGSIGIYLLGYAAQRLSFDRSRKVLAHIGGLVVAILGLFAWGYWLGIWELVLSNGNVIFGAAYTDMHARLPAQWILFAVVIICIGVFIYSIIIRRNIRWLLYAIGGWIAVAILVSGILPAVVQRFQVQPNELAREEPYIEYNIQFTREAFALDRIEEQSFPAEPSPSADDIAQNQATVNNIRLWDPRPLKDTYNKQQSLRPYYDFNDVDIDRYVIDGEYRQVMLSARELSAEKLTGEAQTWVNRRLLYTHGYGIVLSPVNEISAQGQPNLLVKDIPPSGVFDIEYPGIYFGEKTDDYVIVKTETQELDYATRDETIYGSYEGEAGVHLDSFVRRLVYAWQFGDLNILISGELTSETRVLYYRNIKERVSRLAPFLELDGDPYLVVIDGRLFWIQDTYTTSDSYPYSRPYGGINYIRNSVKAVIDAYNGSVTFYVTDAEDALIQTYQAIFPELFVSAEQMPESLRVHLRYPEYMFKMQAMVYQTYHMSDARVFYTKEDLWAIPEEVYFGNQQQPVEPYYIIMRLPDEEKEEFLLMLPFKPANKEIAIGWLAARSDGENYGKLLAYLFPKERTVDGPSLIENRIGQDIEITEQLALWGRGGSQVIRGNLLLIPLARSFLYVEPVFLEAEAGGLPELKRVIVATGDQVAMEPTLAESIAAIFGEEAPPTEPEPPPTEPEPPTDDVAKLVEEAQEHYSKAQEYLKAGDWAGYGSELDALKVVLDRLAELTAQ